MSSTLPEQLQQILEVVSGGLRGVTSSRRSATKRNEDRRRRAAELDADRAYRRERIKKGLWHDGRLDCLSGNGIMSELGVGDEKLSEADVEMEAMLDEQHQSETEHEKKAGETENARIT